MPATRIRGKDGSITIGAATIATLKSFDLQVDAELIPHDEIVDVWTQNVLGMQSWSGSLTCNYDADNTSALHGLDAGETIAIIFYPEGNASGKPTYTGSAIITSASLGYPENLGFATKNISFTGAGELVRSTVGA